MRKDKLSFELREILRSAGTGDAADIAILVTCSEPPDRPLLEATGMIVSRVFENIPAAAGAASREVIESLARLDEVERIDFDSETHAV
jgi:hypothetical protein